MKYVAEVEIKENPEIIFGAMQPEFNDNEYHRAESTIKKKDKKVVINIKAKDSTAFRAMLNSLIKSLMLYEKTK